MIFVEYNAIVVDPDINSRTKLKGAAHAVSSFKKVQSEKILDAALNLLSTNGETWDVVFISRSYSHDEMSEFIEKAKKTKLGEDCAYIVVLKGEDQGGAAIAQEVMKGAHGVLFEPYSVERLQEIAELSAKVKNDNSLLRRKAVVELLVSEIITELDKITVYKFLGCNVDRLMKKFALTCKSAERMDDDQLALYYATLAEIMGEATVPDMVSYKGASVRVRERLEAKIREQYNLDMREVG